ncbi:unnamed protein product [Caretta caretta]
MILFKSIRFYVYASSSKRIPPTLLINTMHLRSREPTIFTGHVSKRRYVIKIRQVCLFSRIETLPYYYASYI